MATPLAKPSTVVEPFAQNGAKNTIPLQQGATRGQASFDLGFPPETMTPVSQGGVPPSGGDFNGILNIITQHTAWLNGGGMYTFDATLVAATGGYRKGAVLQSDDGLSTYISLVDSNTDNFNTAPNTIGTSWLTYGGKAARSQISTVAVTGGTVNLTAAQVASPIIQITGTLTSNLSLVFPKAVGGPWIVINSTTGNFSVAAALNSATLAALTLTQGKLNTVFADGTNLYFPAYDSGLDSPALRGTPTAPTQVANDNSTKIATTGYVDRATAGQLQGLTPQYKNAAFTAGTTGDYWTDTGGGAFVMTLPDPPLNQNLIRVQDIVGMWSINPLTINPGSKTILGTAEPLVCDVSGEYFQMFYDGTTWRLA